MGGLSVLIVTVFTCRRLTRSFQNVFPTDLNTSRMPASVPLACSLSPCRPTACTNLRPACAFHITAKQNNLPTSPPKTQHMCTPSRHGRSWFIQHPFQSFSFTSMHDVDPGFRSQVVLEECCGDMGPGRLTAISTQFPPPFGPGPISFFCLQNTSPHNHPGACCSHVCEMSHGN